MILKPEKYTKLEVSVLAVVAEILRIARGGIIRYDELLRRVLEKKGQEAKENFLPSLNFLFLLGKVKYYKEEDILEFKNEN